MNASFKSRNVVEQEVPDLLDEVVAGGDRQVTIDGERRQVWLQSVAQSANPRALDRLDAGDAGGDGLDPVDDYAVDRIHQPAKHLAREDDEDDRADEQADERSASA